MGKYRFVSPADRNILFTPEELNLLKESAQKAIRSMSFNNKTTNEIFGEVYTKIRTDLLLYGKLKAPTIKKVISHRIRHINNTLAGVQLNDIMNEAYEEFQKKQVGMSNLDMCNIIAQCCVVDAKCIVDESEKILQNIKQINNDLSGVNYE